MEHTAMTRLQERHTPSVVDDRTIIAPASASNAWSFTQGLIAGQVSVIVVILVFIKFFVFLDGTTSTTATGKSAKRDGSGVIVKRNKKDPQGNDSRRSTSKNLTSILEKTYYDVENHAPESLDWFNVLIAQTISQLRTEAILSDNIYHLLDGFLSKTDLPDYLDDIRLIEIDVGDDFPIFSNCRIKHSGDDSGRLEARIDVDLSDTLTLGIETRLLLNHPRPLTAVLPVQLVVSMVRFSGCLTVSLINTNDADFVGGSNGGNTNNTGNTTDHETPGGTALMFSFLPDYRLEFTVKSLIGSRAKLQDVPKVSHVIESKLRAWFKDRCVEPRFQVVTLPSLWPRSKNTREPAHLAGESPDKPE